MKNIKRFLIPLFFIALTFSAAAQENQEALKAEFQKLSDAYAKAMKEGNDDAMLSFYADDAVSLPSYSPMIRGKELIKRSMETMKLSGIRMTEYKLTTLEVSVSGDIACEMGRYEMSFKMKGASNTVSDSGKYVTVYSKTSGEKWKIKYDMWNTDKNPFEQMQRDQ